MVVSAITRTVGSSQAVEIFSRDEACSYGWIDNIVVVLGQNPPTTLTVPNYRACIEARIASFPEGIGVVTIVDSRSTPDPSARDAIVKIFKDHGSRLDASLFVDQAEGFRAAVHRSIGAAFVLASGKRERIRITNDLTSGIAWMLPRVAPEQPSASRHTVLVTAIQKFCNQERLAQTLQAIPG